MNTEPICRPSGWCNCENYPYGICDDCRVQFTDKPYLLEEDGYLQDAPAIAKAEKEPCYNQKPYSNKVAEVEAQKYVKEMPFSINLIAEEAGYISFLAGVQWAKENKHLI